MNIDQFVVRRAGLEDMRAIAPLFNQYRMFYNQPSDADGAYAYLSERAKRGESVIFAAWDRGLNLAVGFTQLYPSFSSISMRNSWILNDLFVADHHRGQGVARQLMNAASEYAAETGAKGLELSTGTANKAAQQLYESLGYERDDDFFHYYLLIN